MQLIMQITAHVIATSTMSSLKYVPGLNLLIEGHDNDVEVESSFSRSSMSLRVGSETEAL